MTNPQLAIVGTSRIETYSGTGEYPPILLLPGLLGGSWIWREVAAGLASAGYEVSILQDPLGLNPLVGDVPKLVAWVTELVEKMYQEPVVIAGNSMGALVSMELAAQRADLLRAVIISGAPGLGEGIQPPDMTTTHGKEFALEQAKRLFWNKDLLTPELFDRVYEVIDGSCSKQKLAMLACVRATRGYDAEGLFQKISVPTLLVWGDQDEVSPKDHWENAVPLFPDARYVGIPEAGHSPMLEQADHFLSVVKQFLDERVHGQCPSGEARPAHTCTPGIGFPTICGLIRQTTKTTADLTPETLLSDVGLDSLGALELMLKCEDELGISLLSDDTPEMHNLQEAGAFIDECLRRRNAS